MDTSRRLRFVERGKKCACYCSNKTCSQANEREWHKISTVLQVEYLRTISCEKFCISSPTLLTSRAEHQPKTRHHLEHGMWIFGLNFLFFCFVVSLTIYASNKIDENGNETSSCRIFQIYTSTSSKRRCIQRSLNGIGQHRGRTKRDEPKSHIDHSYAISNLAFLELQQSMVQLTDLIFLTSTKYTRETKTLHDSKKTTITTYHSPTHISGKSVLYHQESDDETSSPKDGKESLLSTRRANGEKITPGSEIFSNATNILCKQNDSIVANLSFDEMNHNVSVSATSFHSIDRQESVTNSVNVSSTDASSMKEYQDCSSKSERSPAETTLNYSENPSPQRRDKLFPILFAIIVATFGMKLLISAFLLICIVFVFTIFALAALARIKQLETELERAKELHLRQMETLENHHIAEIQLCENEHDEFVSNLIQSHREEVESLHNLMVIYRETSVDTFQMFCNSEARQ